MALLFAGPGTHYKCVVHADAPDFVHASSRKRSRMLHIAWHVLGRAGRRECAGQREDRDGLAGNGFGDFDRVGANAAAFAFDFGIFEKSGMGNGVTDLDHAGS